MEGAALLLLCPPLELISVKSPANLLLLPLPICWLLLLPQHQLRGILGEKLHCGSGRFTLPILRKKPSHLSSTC